MNERVRQLAARVGPFLLTALVAFGGGLFLGSRHAPSRVEEKTHSETTETVKAAERIAERVDTRRTRDTRAHTVTERTQPDGTKVRTERTIERVDRTDTDKTRTEGRTSDTTIAKVEDKHTIKDFGPRARIDLLGGAVLQNPVTNGGLPFSALSVGVGGSGRLGNSPIWVGGQFQMAGDKAHPFELTRDLRLFLTVGWAF